MLNINTHLRQMKICSADRITHRRGIKLMLYHPLISRGMGALFPSTKSTEYRFMDFGSIFLPNLVSIYLCLIWIDLPFLITLKVLLIYQRIIPKASTHHLREAASQVVRMKIKKVREVFRKCSKTHLFSTI